MYLVGTCLSNATSKVINKNEALRDSYTDKKKINKLYKIHLEASAIFYYLFLPLPIVIVLIISGFIIFLLDHYNVISSATLGGILVITIILISAIIKSLHLRNIDISDEFLLKRQEAPELYKICADISKKLESKPIDSIYLDHDASISVFESGRIISHFLGNSKRCLVIGIGALKNLSVSQLKSILAHEHGHLYNKDTAGGSFALFVRRSIKSATDIMEADLVNNWYNPSWIYVLLFQKIFVRISQGAARMQEIMADEISAKLFGSDIFSKSLLDITRNQIEFSITSKIELMNALNKGTEPRNIYVLDVPQSWPDDVTYSYGYIFMTVDRPDGMGSPIDLINFEFQRQIESETHPFDSHPSLKDRIALLNRMKKTSSHDDNTAAEKIIPNIKTYQKVFTKMLYESIAEKREYLTDLEYEKRLNRNV